MSIVTNAGLAAVLQELSTQLAAKEEDEWVELTYRGDIAAAMEAGEAVYVESSRQEIEKLLLPQYRGIAVSFPDSVDYSQSKAYFPKASGPMPIDSEQNWLMLMSPAVPPSVTTETLYELEAMASHWDGMGFAVVLQPHKSTMALAEAVDTLTAQVKTLTERLAAKEEKWVELTLDRSIRYDMVGGALSFTQAMDAAVVAGLNDGTYAGIRAVDKNMPNTVYEIRTVGTDTSGKWAGAGFLVNDQIVIFANAKYDGSGVQFEARMI